MFCFGWVLLLLSSCAPAWPPPHHHGSQPQCWPHGGPQGAQAPDYSTCAWDVMSQFTSCLVIKSSNPRTLCALKQRRTGCPNIVLLYFYCHVDHIVILVIYSYLLLFQIISEVCPGHQVAIGTIHGMIEAQRFSLTAVDLGSGKMLPGFMGNCSQDYYRNCRNRC